MNTIQKGIRTFLIFAAIIAGSLFNFPSVANAQGISTRVRIVGSNRTIWVGDVEVDNCTVTDKEGKQHSFIQPVAICALDIASKAGGFTYTIKDFGGSLGLFLEGIAEDMSASDFSTYWLYDVNGQAVGVGFSTYLVKNGDLIYFYFENPDADVNSRAVNDGLWYLRSQQDTNGQISGFPGISGWAAMTFAAADINPRTVSKDGSSLLDYLAANPPAADSVATDWERAVLAITASGENPSNFGGIDYIGKLETYHNNSQLGSVVQVNDDIFGLLALVSAGSDALGLAKQDALAFILSHQNSDGGFSWSVTGTSDVDDTAAALQALVASQNAGMSAPALPGAITNAKNFILRAKNSDGGFPYVKGDLSNTATTSWVIMALNSLGVTGQDVTNAKSFVRRSQEENGSFRWQSSSDGETFTSSYAVLALTGKFWPVNVFAGISPTPGPTGTIVPSPTAVPTGMPQPSAVPNISKSPSITPKPDLRDEYRDIIRLQNGKIQLVLDDQELLIGRMHEQIQTEIQKLTDIVKTFRLR